MFELQSSVFAASENSDTREVAVVSEGGQEVVDNRFLYIVEIVLRVVGST